LVPLDRKRKIRQTISMKGFLSKVFVFLLFLLSTFYFLSSATQANAVSQTDLTKTSTTASSSVNSDVPNNLHNWTQSVMIEVMSSLTCQLVGIDPTTSNRQCLGVDQKTGKIGFLPAGNLEKRQIGGAIGGMGNMITMLYTPPIHTSDYFQNLAQKFGISKTAYAQTGGKGFVGLQPLMGLWTSFRDIVYTLLVIVFVVIGIGVMLRLKIDPRTVMSIQNQIPKFIVGLLLVTFSFAIAGFLVDLMWVSNSVVFNVISKSATGETLTTINTMNPTALQGKTPFDLAFTENNFNKLVTPVASSSSTIVQKLLDIDSNAANYIPFVSFIPGLLDVIEDPSTTVRTILTHPESLLKITLQNANIGDSPTDYLINLLSKIASALTFFKIMDWPDPSVLGVKIGWIANIAPAGFIAAIVYDAIQGFMRVGLVWIIVYLIIAIALLVALFRLWLMLLMAYISILIDVVLAPFWIIGGVIPGSQISFSGWLKDMGANLAAFPATIFMFALGKVIMDSFGSADSSAFVPPLIGGFNDPKTFSSLIGIGIILITPNVVNLLKAALKAPKMDTGIGKAIGVGPTIITNTARGIGGTFMGQQEPMLRRTPTGTYEWGPRKLARSFWGRFFK